ncbi:LINE-1 retrotransposable element ORF2 protein [Linum grandiflorum]
MRNFNDFIFDAGLDDLQCTGPPLTWSNNNRHGRLVLQRLDRALCNIAWKEVYPKAFVAHKSRTESDHSPIILLAEPENQSRRRRRFYFEIGWIGADGYNETVADAWQQGTSTSTNLKKCSALLTSWKNRTVAHTQNKITSILVRLEQSLTIQEELSLRAQLAECWRIHEAYWSQRSGISWLALGDQNTRFFHASTIQRRRRNMILSLKDESGRWIEEPNELTAHATDFYQSLFSGTRDVTDFSFLQDFPSMVTDDMNALLARPINVAEIKKAVFQLGATKAPGPNGFPGRFFQQHWDTIGPDLCREVLAFFTTNEFPPSWNDTYLTLIPKVRHPESITQFRPINVSNFRAKVISKILASRLQPLLSQLVSDLQAAFTGNRAIQDCIIIAHEVLHKLKIRKKGRKFDFMLKVDMHKAFDRVSWDFLRVTLAAMGFNDRWIKWIEAIVTSVRFAVMINGKPSSFFRPSQGLRQGDPLSPMLFIIVSNVLSYMLQRDISSGLLKGLKLNHRCPTLSHVLFADDTVIFGKASRDEALQLQLTLSRYCRLSGQAINSTKSAIKFSANTPLEVKQQIATIFGTSIDDQLGSYLGLPTEWGRSRAETFRFMLERLQQRASSWKSLILSHGGRETLAKAILQAIPSYLFSCFLLPKSLHKKMDTVLRNFWWAGDGQRRSIHWVSSYKLTSSKDMGGLGFKSFRDFNIAFLAKLGWKIIQQPQALWVRLLKALYFHRSDFISAQRHYRPSWIWNSIMEGRSALMLGLRKNLGNGQSTMLDEAWFPAADDFHCNPAPHLNCLISECILQPQNIWNSSKLHTIFPPDTVREILKIPIGPIHFPDTWVWHWDHIGRFNIKSCYKRIKSQDLPNNHSSTQAKQWKWLWQLTLPPKLKFFVWRAANKALATRANLARRNCSPTPLCPCCHISDETIDHLFFACDRLKGLWPRILPAALTPPTTANFREWFFSHSTLNSSFNASKIAYVCWVIWKTRNDQVFSNIVPIFASMEGRFRREFGMWISIPRSPSIPSPTTVPPPLHQPSRTYTYTILSDASFQYDIQKAGIGVIKYNSNGIPVDGRQGIHFVEPRFLPKLQLCFQQSSLPGTRLNQLLFFVIVLP